MRERPSYTVLGITECHARALQPAFLGRLWNALGAAPEHDVMILDDDMIAFGTPTRHTHIMIDTDQPPGGYIVVSVDNLDAVRTHVEAQGISVSEGTPAGRRHPGFNFTLDGDGVFVRIEQSVSETD